MSISEIQPIINERALFIVEEKTLVLADLHIGIETQIRESGLNITNQTEKITKKIIKLCDRYKPDQIILLGDIKHNIPTSTYRERIDVKNFLEKISNISKVHIVPGNHDGNIKKLSPKKIVIHPSDGFLFKNIGFIHGHRWPKEEIMKSEKIIMAHTHPTIMLSDRMDHKTYEPCWVKTKFDDEKLKEKYEVSQNSNILIIPAFNPLCGGIAVNKDGIQGPMGRIINIEESEIFLIDGTNIGKIKYLI